MSAPLVLVSHALCPYVQRAAIVLAEKGVPFERQDIDLSNRPDWFMKVSPLGKTPVLLVEGTAIFESAVICEYLDETVLRRWTLTRAWPVKFVAGDWDNDADEIVIESVTLTFDFFQLRQ